VAVALFQTDSPKTCPSLHPSTSQTRRYSQTLSPAQTMSPPSSAMFSAIN